MLVANNLNSCGRQAAMANKETTAKCRLRSIQLNTKKTFMATSKGSAMPAKGRNHILTGLI
ncbi:MAG: hypothetical protein IPP60_08535 [Sphingobacteriales bacterium]|nr:hypothetical protein [Sphingobacteriales bacterium]